MSLDSSVEVQCPNRADRSRSRPLRRRLCLERFVLIGVVCSSGGLACGEDETRLTPYDLPQLPPASTGGSPVESPNQPAAGGSGSEAPGGVDPAGTSTEDPIGDPATHPEAEDAPDGDPDATARDGGTNVDADAGPGTNIPPASRDAATEIDEEPDASTGIEEPVDEPIEEPDAGGAIGGEDDPLAPYEPGLTDRPKRRPFSRCRHAPNRSCAAGTSKRCSEA